MANCSTVAKPIPIAITRYGIHRLTSLARNANGHCWPSKPPSAVALKKSAHKKNVAMLSKSKRQKPKKQQKTSDCQSWYKRPVNHLQAAFYCLSPYDIQLASLTLTANQSHQSNDSCHKSTALSKFTLKAYSNLLPLRLFPSDFTQRWWNRCARILSHHRCKVVYFHEKTWHFK